MTSAEPKRRPQAFAVDDPALRTAETEPAADAVVAPGPAPAELRAGGRRGLLAWGQLLIGALVGLALLAAGVSFANFVSIALARDDWVGSVALALAGIAAVSALAIVVRELAGLLRLRKLTRLRQQAEAALRGRDLAAERAIVRRLRAGLAGRPQLAWALARFREHERDMRDPGELLALADRELLTPLDAEARRQILASARRVSVVTALSPVALVAVGFVLTENLGLLRRLATLYGARPGLLGGLRLARLVFLHVVATGGVALTDDLLGQFLGQDLVRRLSRRLGEGVFNGALTARIGTAAIEVTRPLPFIEAPPVRLRDLVAELVKRGPATRAPTAS